MKTRKKGKKSGSLKRNHICDLSLINIRINIDFYSKP